MSRTNNQSTQQQSSELSYSKVAGSSRRPAQLHGWNFLLELLKHRPWLLWSGVWAFLLAITAIAGFSLLHTSYGKQEEPQPTPVQNPTETSSQMGSPMPLWLLGAVAFTCGGGFLVISKRLKRSWQPSKLRKRVKHSFTRVITPRQQERLPVATPPQPQPPVVPVPAETEPVVTVLPPEESNPLDSDSESLADMMDIRKQRSLSSIWRELGTRD